MPPEAARTGEWRGDPDRLDRVLPALGMARSRSQATELILGGQVTIDGAPAAKSGVRVQPGTRLEVHGGDHYVSRAAHKLLAGLEAFAVDPAIRLCLDLGASTGGFTQVLLERGAAAVQAVDVGHGQLVPELRADPRVRVVEGCNARDLTAAALAEATGIDDAPDLVVADLSFISLGLILPAIARVAAPAADIILLIKPQFEVGRVRDGVVTDPALRAEAVRIVLRAAVAEGFGARGLARSPIAGGHGNREFLVHLTRGAAPDPTEWEGRIEALAAEQVGQTEQVAHTLQAEQSETREQPEHPGDPRANGAA